MKNSTLKKLLPLLLLTLLACSGQREYVRIVGSSTVYPFVSTAAYQFGLLTDYRTPVIESTGTGGGMKLFCAGIGLNTPDVSNASRSIKEGERELCRKNGVTDILEIPVGYDGIVVANVKTGPVFALTPDQLFLALAKQVEQDGKLVENHFDNWNQISPQLPDEKIVIYGPPPTSGTRDAFVELVMEKACKAYPAFKAAYPDKKKRKKQCAQLREDGGFVDAGENDNIIVQKLKANDKALGIFGYSFLTQNADTMQGATINGVKPEFALIASGDYAISRSLFMYVKAAHFDILPSLKPFLQEVVSEEAAADEGYMSEKGLIPMPPEVRAANRQLVR